MKWAARGGERRTAAAAAAPPPLLLEYNSGGGIGNSNTSSSNFLFPSSPFCKLEALHSMLSGDYTEESTGARTLRQSSSGAKDRHSKVLTSRGPRDRRVRLSVSTAIRFYDLQDRLGFEQPSKAVDWLLRHAKPAIDALPPLLHLHLSSASASSSTSAAAAGLHDIHHLQQLLCRPRSRHIMTAAPPSAAQPHVLHLDVDADHSNNYSASTSRSSASTADDSIGMTSEASKSSAPLGKSTAPGVQIAHCVDGGCRNYKKRKWEAAEAQKLSSIQVSPPLMEARKWEAELMSAALAPKPRRGGDLHLAAQQCEENKAAAPPLRQDLRTTNAANPNPNPNNVNHAASNYPNPNNSTNLHVINTNYANPRSNHAKYDADPSTTNYSKSNPNTHANTSCTITANSTHTSSENANNTTLNNDDSNNTPPIFIQHSLYPTPNPNNYHHHHLLGLLHPIASSTTTTTTTTNAHSPNNDDLLLPPDSLLFRKQPFLHGGSLLACDPSSILPSFPLDKYLHLPPPDHPPSALIVDQHRSLLPPPPPLPPPRIDISVYNHADIINLHPPYLV